MVLVDWFVGKEGFNKYNLYLFFLNSELIMVDIEEFWLDFVEGVDEKDFMKKFSFFKRYVVVIMIFFGICV